ncbi:MAG: CoA ester lyase [Acholeplasmataceae bacterium]
MRRSLLFIPASSPAMLQNADVFGADAVIFDLEDAISVEEKDAARILLNRFLTRYPLDNIEVIVRINGLDSPYFLDDLESLKELRINTIMVPKATVNDLIFLDDWIKEYHANKDLGFIPIIESAEAVLNIKEISMQKRVNGLLLGAEDLASDLGVRRTKDGTEIFVARSMVVLAAKSRGYDAIDTPFIDTADEFGLIEDTKFAKTIGMNAKACIHPNQVLQINQVLSPSLDEIERAQRILLKEKAVNKGVFSVDGKMVDKPILDRARKTLMLARKWKLIADE